MPTDVVQNGSAVADNFSDTYAYRELIRVIGVVQEILNEEPFSRI